jgi:uncharacterized protein (DUF2345 family)
MDQDVIATHLENLDRRLSTVEQILPTVATKNDLAAFATKDDLSAFATKDDLAAFATKDDLTAFATKDDLTAFATKDDLTAFATKDDLTAFATKNDLTPYATKEDLTAAVAPFATREELNDMSADLRGEIREEGERSRVYMKILIEQQDRKLDLLAEHVLSLMPKESER